MKIHSFRSLKHLAIFAMLLFLYPVMLCINGLFGHDATSGLVKSLVFIGIAYSGYFFGVMIKKRLNSLFITAYLVVTLSVPPILIYFLMKQHIIELFVAICLVFVVYFIGMRFSKLSDLNVLSQDHYFYISLVYLISTFALWLCKIENSIIIMILVYLFITIVYGLVHNRANIERNMKKRKYSLDYLPKKITSYNTALLGISFVFVLIGICFISPLVSLFNTAADGTKSLIVSFVSKINVPVGEEGLVLGKGVKTNDLLSGLPQGGSSSNIFNIICAVLVLFLIFIFRDEIKTLLFTNSVKRLKPKKEETVEYTDIEQASLRGKNKVEQNHKSEYKQWKKAYKIYCRMSESIDKYKFGYSLAIKGLEFGGVLIEQSDTTIEIMEKAKKVLDDKHYDSATYTYNDIRYGNNGFHTNDIDALNQTLKRIIKM